MKAQIFINGQISGNFKLLNNITYYEHEKGMFNSFYCFFNSVKEAKEAIRKAYWSIRGELDPDNYNVVYKSKDNSSLSYDASSAKVRKETKAGYIDC